MEEELRLLKRPGGLDALRPLLEAVARLDRDAAAGRITLTSHDIQILEALQRMRDKLAVIRKQRGSDNSDRFPPIDPELLVINS